MPGRERKPVNQVKNTTRTPRLHVKQAKVSLSRLKAAAGGRREAVNQSRINN